MEFLKKNLTKNIILTLLYALITLVVVLHHEIWADEAQVWQLCRHLSLPELFKHLVNEGHPSFFYLLNMPFAKMGCSIMVMQIICWFSSCVAVLFLLWKSPFTGLTKFAIITSAGFLYFFPVIARSYSLIPMLVFALAFLYPKQKEHPYWYAILIAILANIHVLMFGFCTVLTLLFVYENLIVNRTEMNNSTKKNFSLATTIAVLGLGLVVFQLCGTMGSNVAIGFVLPDFFKIFSVFSLYFLNNINGYVTDYIYIAQHNINLSVVIMAIICAILYCCLFICLFLKNKKMFFISLLGIVFQFFVYIFSYQLLYTTRVFCGHVILIFAIWLAINQDDKKNILTKIINYCLYLCYLHFQMV